MSENKPITNNDLCEIEIFETSFNIGTTTSLNYKRKNLMLVPSPIQYLTNLQDLILNNNDFAIIPDFIGNLTNLKYLYLENNKLVALPYSIGRLINLHSLDLYNNNLTFIPDSLGNLINLRYLDLSNNKLLAIPDSIVNLTNLQELNLQNNNLTSLPNSIGVLKKLRQLILINNNLISLPNSILKIKEHIYLNESSYQIDNLDLECEILLFTKLSSSLVNLPINLKEIWLSKFINIKETDIKLPFNTKIYQYGCELYDVETLELFL